MAVPKWDRETKQKISKSMIEYNKCVRRKLEMSDTKCGNEGKKMRIKEDKIGELRKRREEYFKKGRIFDNESIIDKPLLEKDMRLLGLQKEMYNKNGRIKSKTELFKVYKSFIEKNKSKIINTKKIKKIERQYETAKKSFKELKSDKYLMKNLRKNITTLKKANDTKKLIDRYEKDIDDYNEEYIKNTFILGSGFNEIDLSYIRLNTRINRNIDNIINTGFGKNKTKKK